MSLQYLPAAYSNFRSGRLEHARDLIADVIAEVLGDSSQWALDPFVAQAMDFTIAVELALGNTAAAERINSALVLADAAIAAKLNPLAGREESSRVHLFPRDASRLFLAATARMGQAIEGAEAEYRYQGDGADSKRRALRTRTEIAVAADASPEIVYQGAQWVRLAEAARRERARDKFSPPMCELEIEDEGAQWLLMGQYRLALAQMRPLTKYVHLLAARRHATQVIDLASSEGLGILRIEGTLLSGRTAAALGQFQSSLELLEAAQVLASNCQHRQLQAGISLALAQTCQSMRSYERALAYAKHAAELSLSRDGGRPIQPTLSRAFGKVLELETRRRLAGEQLVLLPQEVTATNTDTDGRYETVILVHGTFAAPSPSTNQWYERGSEFCRALDEHLAANGSTARAWAHLAPGEREFFWTGENSWIDRDRAAEALANYIVRLSPHWRCHLVAHSHGGNVCHQALQILANDGLGAEIRCVTLGTPFFHEARHRSTRGSRDYSSIVFWLILIVLVVAGTIWLGWWFLLAVPVVLVLLVGALAVAAVAAGPGAAVAAMNAADSHAAAHTWPRSLAISCEADEALKAIRMAFRKDEPHQVRGRPSTLTIVAATWRRNRLLASAQGKRLTFRPLRIVSDTVVELAQYRIVRSAWNVTRNRLAGLSGATRNADHYVASPRPAVRGSSIAGVYEPLPADLEEQAIRERARETPGLVQAVDGFLAAPSWSIATVEEVLRAATIEKIVHSFYYRNPRCVRRVARWLATPNTAPADLRQALIMKEAGEMASPPVQGADQVQSPWDDGPDELPVK